MPAFDVFVSYSRADQDAVERLGRALRERGLTVFVDRWYLVAGQSWPEALEKHLRDCRAVAVCINPPSSAPTARAWSRPHTITPRGYGTPAAGRP
jgi:hypothetical protein